MSTARDILASFPKNAMPDLDTAVFGALELFERAPLPSLAPLYTLERPLVFGSENALATAKILFGEQDAIFGDENTYHKMLLRFGEERSAILVSASGGKHARAIAHALQEKKDGRTWLITTNPQAPAAEYIASGQVLLFPKNREPYTYNVSTYLGMILAHTHENTSVIRKHIEEHVLPRLEKVSLSEYAAYCFLLPASFEALVPMVRTKFDELFGPKLCARVFTLEQAKHAKTVIASEEELFISVGEENLLFGAPHRRLFLPLPTEGREGALMAIAYSAVGAISRAYPPYFKDNVQAYCAAASRIFGEMIEPIVE